MSCNESQLSHPAVITLANFFKEMREWENGLIATSKKKWRSDKEYSSYIAKQGEKLREVFSLYCEAGKAAKRLEGGGFSFQEDDTEYDPEREIIESIVIKPKRVIVFTKQNQPYKHKVRYEIVLKEGEWRICDKTKYCFQNSEKWHSSSL